MFRHILLYVFLATVISACNPRVWFAGLYDDYVNLYGWWYIKNESNEVIRIQNPIMKNGDHFIPLEYGDSVSIFAYWSTTPDVHPPFDTFSQLVDSLNVFIIDNKLKDSFKYTKILQWTKDNQANKSHCIFEEKSWKISYNTYSGDINWTYTIYDSDLY